ncbi:RidA family protein [Pseudoclavibacter terrae]|uniref:RidA family protein n=1 Tax=Pseudoclavibacter terrae TaxID=1530195 RepID=UPI0023301390|nr:RidA family protein [Pseudoclavibacter terrae]
MSLTIVSPSTVPAPGGQYSTAVVAGNTVYLAGQVGIDPETGVLADSLEGQVRQALTNFVAVLEAAGSAPELVVKTLCFLTDTANFATFNAVYTEFFPDAPPARSTVGVALAGDLLFEIEGIALRR